MTTIHSTDWRASASCRNQAPDFDANVDGETWTERNDRVAAAIATCGECLVRAACEADIDPLIDVGIRAGIVLTRDDNNVPAGGGRGKISRAGKKPTKTNLNNSDREGNRRELVLELTEKGLSAQEIADRLGVSTRAVTRHRAAGRAA